MNQAPNPYAAPMVAQQETATQAYARVPFYRRNGVLSALLLLGLVTAIAVPIVVNASSPLGAVLVGTIAGSPLFAACIVTLTGPVYFDAFVAPGQLKTWSVANKVVAVIMLGGWLYSVVSIFIG